MFKSCCALVAVLTPAIAIAADTTPKAGDYPHKPVRILLPTAAGGSLDTIARVVANKLGAIWQQQPVVDNRAGAGGIIGVETAARATPDGYTLLIVSTGNIATTQALYKNIPYDPVRDFSAVILMAETPYVLVVHPSVPAKNTAELIQLAKSKPGQLNFSSSGSGSTPHLGGELFKLMTGVNIVHVPYKGSPAALNSLVSGETLIEFAGIPSTWPQVKAGRIRALGTASAKRSAMAPELPTISESGLPGYAVSSWAGMLAPAGVPKPIIARLNSDVTRVLTMPDARQQLLGQGFEVLGSTPEHFASYLRSEISKWGKVIREAKVKAD